MYQNRRIVFVSDKKYVAATAVAIIGRAAWNK